ncbi:MAG: DUF1624 domain-containing protein [Planctomycetes bacterium]|nr:DUF1624 domain-containing protein [Planctomycetota bacterium]
MVVSGWSGTGAWTSCALANLDLLRGLAMVVMVLDHVRDFVHTGGVIEDPTDLATTTPGLFATRWITHFCAPTFVFLAGLSVRLQLQRGADPRVLAGSLRRRGLFLVGVEVVLLRPLILFQFDHRLVAFLQVIWKIGVSMCLLSAMLRWRVAVVGGLGLLLVFGLGAVIPHESFLFAPAFSIDAAKVLLLLRGAVPLWNKGPVLACVYPLLPWFGVMALGYATGTLCARAAEVRRRWLLWLGLAATGLFAVLRAVRGYGDPGPWNPRVEGWRAVVSFFRVEKYPPSLQFVAMTLGPVLLFPAFSERLRGDGPLRRLVALGRAPLVFYVLQWPAAHLVSRLFQWLDGQPVGWDRIDFLGDLALPEGCGFSLPVVYLAWSVTLLVITPLTFATERWRTARERGGLWRYV